MFILVFDVSLIASGVDTISLNNLQMKIQLINPILHNIALKIISTVMCHLTKTFIYLTCMWLPNFILQVNSTVQAKMHYTGKQHEKKVTQFLTSWSQETGEPIPVRLKDGPTPPKKVLFHVTDYAILTYLSLFLAVVHLHFICHTVWTSLAEMFWLEHPSSGL